MRKTGYLGEGGFMMRNNLYGMNVERTVRYDVHELRIKDWESMIGQPIEEALDLKSDQKAILGYYNGNPITAGGQKNYIENVFEMGDGKLGIEVRETVGFGTGTKVDPVKGLVHGVTNDEFTRIKEGLNLYHQAAGTGGYIPSEADALQILHYGHNKTEGGESVLNITTRSLPAAHIQLSRAWARTPPSDGIWSVTSWPPSPPPQPLPRSPAKIAPTYI